MARRHEISSAPENMVWGYLDSANPPILTVNSGDTVTLHSFPAGGKETLPEDLSRVPADYLKALDYRFTAEDEALIDKLVVYPQTMQKNLDRLGGLVGVVRGRQPGTDV